MAFWSERHVMQLDKRVLKLARELWLIVCWPSKDFKLEILNVCFFQVSMGVCRFDGFIVLFDRTGEQTTHTGSLSPSVSL